MSAKAAASGAMIGLAALIAATTIRLATPQQDPDPTASSDAADILPAPPLPSRIAEGPDYDHCLSLLRPDPAEAARYADAWLVTGGGDGARHCHALSALADNDPRRAARELTALATESHAAAAIRATALNEAGQAWMMASDPPQAYAAFTLALALNPDDPDLLIDRSVAAASQARYAEAIDDLDAALRLDPGRVDAMVFRGAARRHLNQIPQAWTDIQQALARDPDNAEALLERGILHQRRHEPAEARADWTRAAAAPDAATADLAQQNLSLLDADPDPQN